MSTSNSLGVLTARLNPVSQQRLFEFLDVIDTDSAARFRSWLGAASDAEVGAAAESLSRASHGREFADWWRSHDELPAAAQVARPVVQRRRRRHRHRHTRFGHRHSQTQTHGRSGNRDLTVGGAWLLGGLLVTVVSYGLAASSPGGGRYVIASGAVLYGAIRLIRGLKAG